jgi:hypothetical protein
VIYADIIGNPSIELVQNNEGVVCASLRNWDIAESEDSYTLKEVNELIDTLEKAKRAMAANNDYNQMNFDYYGDKR